MPDSPPRPKLVSVPDAPAEAPLEPAAAEPPQPEAEERRPGDRRRRWLSVLLILAFALLVGLYGSALRENAGLEARIGALEGELAGARARIDAHEVHLEDVRDRVGGVSSELEALEALVERGPEASPGI